MSSDDVWLAAAMAIGRRIVADAVWHDRRCNWIGAVADAKQPWGVEYRGLGPSVYDGTAGVGLYLAQLATLTGELAARRTAIGALRHALECAPELAPADRDGFHAGTVGVALAASRVGALLDEHELVARARALLPEIRLP